MANDSRFLRLSRRSSLVLALALVAVVLPGRDDIKVIAQAATPCALVTTDDVKSLAVQTSVDASVARSFPPADYSSCRYAWGSGLNRYKLDVTVSEGSRMFTGIGPDGIKQGLLATVKPETADAVIPAVGDAAVFNADSPAYAYATAYIKGRIVQVHLDGLDARDKKDQVIALLKTAASRL